MKAFNMILTLLSLTLLSIACMACQTEHAGACNTSDDCLADELCRYDRCVIAISSPPTSAPPATLPPRTLSPPSTQQEPAADTTTAPPPEDATPPGDPAPHEVIMEESSPAEPDPLAQGCAGEEPRPGELVINEVLANVPAEIAGDANADGARDAYEDEFVELVNISQATLSLRGVSVASAQKPKLTFGAELCLAPLEAVVVFGGPKGAPHERQGLAHVVRSTSRLGLSNSAGSVQLLGARGELLFAVEYADSPLASFVLSPELFGEHFVSHETHGALFSPGTCQDGAAFDTLCAPAQ